MKKEMERDILSDAAVLSVIVSLILLFVFEIAYGQPPGLQGPAGLDGQSGLHFRAAHAEGPCEPQAVPPPEAYRACRDRDPGSTARFTAPSGEVITGTCREEEGGQLVLIPDPLGDMELAGGPHPPACCGDEPFPMPGECGDPFPFSFPWEWEDFGRMGFMD